MKNILVTGGAGFLGSFLVDRLVAEGYSVVVLDTLERQVHGQGQPDYINPKATYVWGDCVNRQLVAHVLDRVEAVYHMAALVGVGQSMYEVERYTHGNCTASAVLHEEVIRRKDRIRKVIVASSMSIYGEGAYTNPAGQVVFPGLRSEAQLKSRQWEVLEPGTGAVLKPIPTPEHKPLDSGSIYAMSKRYQEELGLVLGRAYGIPTVACRFFNAYGSRQALSNPYTGVAAIFCSRFLQGLAPVIFEDGEQMRDFVHVSDIVQGLLLCLTSAKADYEVFNLGSGHPISIRDVAAKLGEAITGGRVQAEVPGQFRAGDIRHCFADISKAQRLLGYAPQYRFDTGIPELVGWVKHQKVAGDKLAAALAEARARGIVS